MATDISSKKKTAPKKNELPAHSAITAAPPKPRRLHLPAYKPFRWKRIKHPERLPSVWTLTKKTCVLLWSRRWLFLGISLVYGMLTLVFVQGLSGGADVNSLKQQLGLGIGGNAGQLVTGTAVFTQLLAASGSNSSATAGAYQLFIGLVVSLATIWALRQTVAGQRIRLRDAFYRGMYPLVPFILVLCVILLQLLPFLIGGLLYTTVVSSGIAVYTLEKAVWLALFLVLACVTVYLLCSSLFALYIVTLPDMTPMKALRSARQLVRYRRTQVFRKLLFLPVALLIAAFIVMLPFIVFAAGFAQWVFFVLSMLGLVIVHAYMYTVYKELLA